MASTHSRKILFGTSCFLINETGLLEFISAWILIISFISISLVYGVVASIKCVFESAVLCYFCFHGQFFCWWFGDWHIKQLLIRVAEFLLDFTDRMTGFRPDTDLFCILVPLTTSYVLGNVGNQESAAVLDCKSFQLYGLLFPFLITLGYLVTDFCRGNSLRISLFSSTFNF